jgi:hypothetical protein
MSFIRKDPRLMILEMKTRQSCKIRELGGALITAGFRTLDEQARALGLSRSTAWAVLKANHKASGLAAATISRMLSSPELPTHVRATILTYVEEKLAGLYGHNKIQLRRLAAFMADATLTDSDAWRKHPTKYNAEAA